MTTQQTETRTVGTEWGDALVTETPVGVRPARPEYGIPAVTLYDFTVTFRGETNGTGRSAGRVDDLVVRDIARHVIWRDTGDLPPLPRSR